MKFGNFTRSTRRGQKYMPPVDEAKPGEGTPEGTPEDVPVWPPMPKPTAQVHAEAGSNVKNGRMQAANAWFDANQALGEAHIEHFKAIYSLTRSLNDLPVLY